MKKRSSSSTSSNSISCIGKHWYLLRCFPHSNPKSAGDDDKEVKKNSSSRIEDVDISADGRRKPGGWKTMPYIVGNETFERLATFGMLANFLVYLVNHLHMKRVTAVNLSNIWFGTTNFAPLLGAFLSDAYLGRFLTLAFASIASFLGMVGLTLTAAIPAFQPSDCGTGSPCQGPSPALLGVLFLSLGLLTIGAGGIRPCSLPFGVDQFDPTTEQGRKGINSFFNWYYFTFTVAVMIAITLIVYIQDTVSWALGLGIPTLLMFFSITLFFLGTRFYVHVPPEGSIFSGIIQVFVASYKKRSLTNLEDQALILYDPSSKSSIVTKLPLTQQFSFLNKAAVILEGEVKPEGSPTNPWRLCSVQQIEEVKCLIRIVPIWASGILCFVAMAQQGTFSVLQAMKMNRHLGPHFQIPPGSLGVISMLTMTIFIPIYDRFLVPAITRITHREGGITVLQRMGIGNAISVVSMVVAALVEEKRRTASVALPVAWLVPQLSLMGLAEALNGIGQIEFYYKEFPEHMRSFAGSLFFCSLAGSSYLSSVLVALVHRYTGGGGRSNWLDDNIDVGKLDYFYYLLAVLAAVNVIYFVVCAYFYRYKGSADHPHGQPPADEEGDGKEEEDRERDEVRSKV